jgi:aspartate kinase
MARLVMKFGGTSVADLDRIRNVAAHVKREVDAGHQVAVVVSAMAGKTNELVALCRGASSLHDAREYDAVVASGEQVTSGLLAITLQAMGVDARSWQGWQLPIVTDGAHGAARIQTIDGSRVIAQMEEGRVAVIAGFQGIGPDGRISTLGRGGSDTSAVAIAAAVKADRCDIYTDVDGVYTTDPRVVPKARRLEKVSFEEMLEMASLGSKVLQVRSVELAMVHKVRTFVRSSFEDPNNPKTMPNGDPFGTLICDEDEIVEQEVVTGIAYSKDEAQISIRRVPDQPGVAAAVFVPLAEANVNVDMIVQNISADGAETDITFTLPAADYERANAVLTEKKAEIGYKTFEGTTGMCKVSVIGVGMRSHAGVAAQAFKALSQKGINIRAITTSEIKISVLIDEAYTELAVRTLHSTYGLDKA